MLCLRLLKLNCLSDAFRTFNCALTIPTSKNLRYLYEVTITASHHKNDRRIPYFLTFFGTFAWSSFFASQSIPFYEAFRPLFCREINSFWHFTIGSIKFQHGLYKFIKFPKMKVKSRYVSLSPLHWIENESKRRGQPFNIQMIIKISTKVFQPNRPPISMPPLS